MQNLNDKLGVIGKKSCLHQDEILRFAQDDNFDIFVYPVILSEAKNLILTQSNSSTNQNLISPCKIKEPRSKARLKILAYAT